MKVDCTDNKTFRLTDSEGLIGELTYENFFSYAAKINLANSDYYDIKSVGFFGTSIVVTKNDTEIANLKMNWKGQIVMTFQDEQEYVFKSEGVFHIKYLIENKEGGELIRLNPQFNWGKLNYSYEISYEKEPQDSLFVLLGVYAANYYMAAIAGSV